MKQKKAQLSQLNSPGITLSRWLVLCVAGVALAFLVIPIGVLIIRALVTDTWLSLSVGIVWDAIYLSFITSAFTVIFIVLFGTPLAYIFARWHFPLKRWLNILIELPIVLPPAVAGLALLTTFGRRGLFGGVLSELGIALPFTTAAVVLAQTFVAAPFYIRAAQVGFQGVPRELEDAGRVDGADGIALFLFITLPLALRALLAGLILAWARALGEFGATILFAGSLQGRTQTMPLLIYNILERDINASIATAVLLIGFALMALIISQWLARTDERE